MNKIVKNDLSNFKGSNSVKMRSSQVKLLIILLKLKLPMLLINFKKNRIANITCHSLTFWSAAVSPVLTRHIIDFV